MAMDDEDGLSFGYQTAQDVTDAVRRRFRQDNEADGGRDREEGGPFVYQAEGLTFAFVKHEGKEGGEVPIYFSLP